MAGLQLRALTGNRWMLQLLEDHSGDLCDRTTAWGCRMVSDSTLTPNPRARRMLSDWHTQTRLNLQVGGQLLL